jgi:hypothetical protein
MARSSEGGRSGRNADDHTESTHTSTKRESDLCFYSSVSVRSGSMLELLQHARAAGRGVDEREDRAPPCPPLLRRGPERRALELDRARARALCRPRLCGRRVRRLRVELEFRTAREGDFDHRRRRRARAGPAEDEGGQRRAGRPSVHEAADDGGSAYSAKIATMASARCPTAYSAVRLQSKMKVVSLVGPPLNVSHIIVGIAMAFTTTALCISVIRGRPARGGTYRARRGTARSATRPPRAGRSAARRAWTGGGACARAWRARRPCTASRRASR